MEEKVYFRIEKKEPGATVQTGIQVDTMYVTSSDCNLYIPIQPLDNASYFLNKQKQKSTVSDRSIC